MAAFGFFFSAIDRPVSCCSEKRQTFALVSGVCLQLGFVIAKGVGWNVIQQLPGHMERRDLEHIRSAGDGAKCCAGVNIFQ